MIKRHVVFSLLAFACAPAVGRAQVIDPPPQRAFRGLFGGSRTLDTSRVSQDLVFTLNALGGYDDNAATGDEIGAPGTPAGPGYTGVFDAALRYRRGRAANEFTMTGAGSYTAYREVPLPNSQTGGLQVAGTTQWGRRNTFSGSAQAEYSSMLALNGPLDDFANPDTLPSQSSLQGLLDSASWQVGGSGAFGRQWTPVTRTNLTYTYSHTLFDDELASDLENQSLVAQYARRISRWTSLTGNYEYAKTQYGLGPDDPGRPLTENRVSGGFDVLRRLSATRNFSAIVQAGAMHVDSVAASNIPYELWTPYVQATTRLDLVRSWSVFGSYQRTAEAVSGLAQPEAYITDSVSVSLAGLLAPRLDLAVTGGLATGTVGASEVSSSDYHTSGASVQLRFALTRMLGTVVSYHYYHYKFTDTTLPTGLPPEYSRNAIRVGISLWLPLYGAYADQRP